MTVSDFLFFGIFFLFVLRRGFLALNASETARILELLVSEIVRRRIGKRFFCSSGYETKNDHPVNREIRVRYPGSGTWQAIAVN